MNRFRIGLVAGLATLVLGVLSVPAASASNGTTVAPTASKIAALKTIHIHGVTKHGKKFNGTYAIQGFYAGKTKVYSLGTLRGKLGSRHVTLYEVRMPARLTRPSSAHDAQATCTVLNLELGPIDLNLLGLRVQLFGGTNPANPLPVSLLITAVPGNGNLLGNLLCGLTNALNPTGALSQLDSSLQSLSATLTSLVSIVGKL